MVTIETIDTETKGIRVRGVIVIYVYDTGLTVEAIDMVNDKYLHLEDRRTINCAIQELIEAGIPQALRADYLNNQLGNLER